MEPIVMRSLKMSVELERWPRKAPFRITGRTSEVCDVVVVTLEKDGHVGRGEASGVHYRGESVNSIQQQIESSRTSIETQISLHSLQSLFAPGGARNALDCALWDMEAKIAGQPVWQRAGLAPPQPLLTTFTCGADIPEKMAAAAIEYKKSVNARAIKLKLTGEPNDADRVRAVREALPDIWLMVDANRGFDRPLLEGLMPTLVAARVALIEQPFPIGQEALLDGLQLPIPVAADESVQHLSDIQPLAGRFSMINIKLDKCGGLTEGLAMVKAARAAGLETMVGCMSGTSLAMAPGFLVGQFCKFVDLDGPALLSSDRPVTVRYVDGLITCPETLWGYPA
jgi:L-alanine-DL-glutamate epimerase-like enolase superfamily enzyme